MSRLTQLFFCMSTVAIACSPEKDDDDDDWSDESSEFGGSSTGGVDPGGSSNGDDEGTDGAGSSGGSSGGSDGGSESGGTDGADDLGGVAETCPHPYNPVHRTSWEKTYQATFIDDLHGEGTATATEQGMGTGYTSKGVEAFKTWESMDLSTGKAWEGSVYHLCDHDSVRGLTLAEWNMEISYAVEFDTVPVSPGNVLMILSAPRQYLPGTEMIGTGESWSFDYDLEYIDPSGSAPFGLRIPVEGSYTDNGLVEIEVMGETMTAWHIQSAYGMQLVPPSGDTAEPEGSASTTVTGVPGFTRDYPGIADYYWVQDLGLVYERHVDRGTGAVVLEKTLLETVGL